MDGSSTGNAGNTGNATGVGNAQSGGESQSTATAQTNGDANIASVVGDNVENSSETATEKAEQKEYRKMFRERINKHYPDADPEDNEGFYKNAYERYDGLSQYQKKNQAVNKQMIDTFNSNPELSGMMRDIMKGAPINIAIARNIDVDSLKPIEGDVDESEWSKALEERKQKLSESEKYKNSLTENMNVSLEEVKAFANDEKLTGEEAGEFLSQIDELVGDVIQGKLTRKSLSKLYRVITADKEISEAAQAAEVKGRNAKIEAIKAEVEPKGDNIPDLKSTTEDQGGVEDEPLDGFNQAIEHQLKKNRM